MADANYPDNINFNVTDIDNNSSVRSGINTYSGTIKLSDIKNNKKVTLRINIDWQNIANYDTSDSDMGTKENSYINIPAVVKISQYLGESIIPYS